MCVVCVVLWMWCVMLCLIDYIILLYVVWMAMNFKM